MEIHNLLDIKSRTELREWLIQNHKTEKECWVVVKRGRATDDNTFWYIDAVEEALCFGWIDSTTKKIANEITVQKLCPRKPRSNWSELNKERCRRIGTTSASSLIYINESELTPFRSKENNLNFLKAA